MKTEKMENKSKFCIKRRGKWGITAIAAVFILAASLLLTGCSMGQKVTVQPKDAQAGAQTQQTASVQEETEVAESWAPDSAAGLKNQKKTELAKATATPVPSLSPAAKDPYQASDVKKADAVSPLQAENVAQTPAATPEVTKTPIVTAAPEPTKTPIVTAAPEPETAQTPAPEVTEAPVPEVTEAPAPEVTEAPAPEVTEAPAPEVTEAPAPEMTEAPAPEVTEAPAPEVTEAPASEAAETPEAAEAPETAEPTPEESVDYEGRTVIVLDPGHSGVQKGESVPIGPGSSEMKDGDAVGTSGVASGLQEYELNMAVAQQLKAELEARGYAVILTHEDNETAINCDERAEVANSVNAACFIRIHADGLDDPSAVGASAICITPQNPWTAENYTASKLLSDSVLNAYCGATGIANRGIIEEDNMTGNNWSKVPTTLLELGFMTNPDEDLKMADPSFQQIMARGIADGIEDYFRRLAAGETVEEAPEEETPEEETAVDEAVMEETPAEEPAAESGSSVREPAVDEAVPAGEVPAAPEADQTVSDQAGEPEVTVEETPAAEETAA